MYSVHFSHGNRRYNVYSESGHLWPSRKCPDYQGILISGVTLYTNMAFGAAKALQFIKVSSLQRVLIRGIQYSFGPIPLLPL